MSRFFVTKENWGANSSSPLRPSEKNKKKREALEQKQAGVSPLTGDVLAGRRLEKHHIKEKHDGGKEGLDNEQLIPITEHLAEHLRRSMVARTERERLRELDTVMWRLPELTEEERREFNELIPRLTGKNVKFF